WMAWRRTVGRIGLEAFGFLLVLVPAVLLMQASLGTWRPAPLIDGVPLWGPALPGSAALVLVPLAVLGLRRRSEELIGLRPLLLVGLLAAVPWLLTGRSLQARAGYLPLVALLPAAGVALEPWLKRSLATSRALVAGAAGVLLVTGFALVPREGPRLAEHVWGPLAAWADGAGLGTIDNQLLADEVGMVGWFTGAVVQPAATGDQDLVLQLQGLERLAELRAIHEGSDVKVRYLLLPTTRGKLEALRSSGELSRAWYPIERFSVSGSTGLEPDLLAGPERAQGDYLLFHRRR
ncbi:MAG: hypothetical protein O2816_19245, partial [Planctomycetota bacterium]|nr:hypothetical protein [Planctomycetota bacterium]